MLFDLLVRCRLAPLHVLGLYYDFLVHVHILTLRTLFSSQTILHTPTWRCYLHTYRDVY
jgi:hypothetical protein